MHWLLAPANARITFFSKIGGRKLLPTPHPRLSQRLCPWIPGGFRGVHQGSPEQTLGISLPAGGQAATSTHQSNSPGKREVLPVWAQIPQEVGPGSLPRV